MLFNMYIKNKVLVNNLIWRTIQTISKQGITLIIFFLCANLLSPYEFGVYNYLLTIIFIIIIFSDFGISTATSKYVAEYSIKDRDKLKGVLFNAGIIILGLALLFTIFLYFLSKFYLSEEYLFLIYLAPLLFLVPITALYDGIYRGLKRFKSLALISTIIGSVSIILVYYLINNFGLIGALVAQNLFYLLLFLGLATSYRDFNLRFNKEIILEIGKYSFIIGLGMIGLMLYTRIDILFLGNYGYIKEISYYEIANKILMFLLVPFTIIGQVIAPDITRHYAEKDFHEIRKKFKKYLFISFISSIIILSLLALSYQKIFEIFLPNYNDGVMFLIMNLMFVVYFTQMLNGIISIGFVPSTGHASISTTFLIIFGLFHVVLNYLFINSFGFIGIIYSIIITKVITDILFIIYYYNILK